MVIPHPEQAYLELLSQQYPTEEAVCSEIIQLGPY